MNLVQRLLNTAKEHADIKLPKPILLAACMGCLLMLWMLFSNGLRFDFGADRPVTRVEASTPFADEVAAEVDDRGVYVDPLLATTVGEELITDEVTEAVRASRTPVRVVALALSSSDGHNGRADVMLRRIAVALGDADGFYVLIDQRQHVTHLWVDADDRRIHHYPPRDLDSVGLADYLREVDDKVENARKASGSHPLLNSAWLGVSVGLTVSIPLWFLCSWIRRSARGKVAHLEGFRQ